jgi:hypothetical protein
MEDVAKVAFVIVAVLILFTSFALCAGSFTTGPGNNDPYSRF